MSSKQYSSTKTFDELKNDYNTIFDSNIKEITKKLDNSKITELQGVEIKLNELLDKVIVGKEDVPIKQLIDKLNNKNWIEQGQEYVQSSEGKCPFCQQDLTEDFKQQLKLLFDEEYKTSINEIKQLKTFIPVYKACGGFEIEGLDYMLATKVFRKFEMLNLGLIRDEIKGLINQLDNIFGKDSMTECIAYLRRLQKSY